MYSARDLLQVDTLPCVGAQYYLCDLSLFRSSNFLCVLFTVVAEVTGYSRL